MLVCQVGQKPSTVPADEQLFHSIAAPLLYTHIFTDKFPSLIGSNIKSLRANMSFARSLRIEYGELNREPTYADLLQKGWTATFER